MRADALASRERILAAAAALVGDRRVSMAEIAAAAGVGRSILYRHFPTRQALDHALRAVDSRAGGSPGDDPSARSDASRRCPSRLRGNSDATVRSRSR